MKPFEDACQFSDRSQVLLLGELSETQQREFETHLDDCPHCRQQLELAAGESECWTEASQFLGDDPFRSSLHSKTLQSSWLHEKEENRAIGSAQISQVLQSLHPTDDPAMLGRLGSYEVSGVIGSGGMGVVLKAIDRPLDRTVAIKVLAPHLASSGAARQRFEREAKAAAAVLHPNVVAIHGVSNDSELPFLVMPYLGGFSLQRRIDQEGPLPIIDILRIGTQIAAGLSAAHEQGLVHRDIKPANVMLEDGVERVAITDFGLARAVDDASMTKTGIIAGTPQYMSPEQARGETVDSRSDLFSLGSVLYALCTGHPPFRADSTFGMLRRITDVTPRPVREINPEVPVWLSGLIDRLHQKSPHDRFESAAEVAELFAGCLAHWQNPTLVPLPGAVHAMLSHEKRSARHRLFKTLAVVAVVSLSVWGGWALLQSSAWFGAPVPSVSQGGGSGDGQAVVSKGQSEFADDVDMDFSEFKPISANTAKLAESFWGDHLSEKILRANEQADRLWQRVNPRHQNQELER